MGDEDGEAGYFNFDNQPGKRQKINAVDKHSKYIVKAADPTWEPGKKIKAGALDGITREEIDKSLTVTNGQYGETFKRGFDMKLQLGKRYIERFQKSGVRR